MGGPETNATPPANVLRDALFTAACRLEMAANTLGRAGDTYHATLYQMWAEEAHHASRPSHGK